MLRMGQQSLLAFRWLVNSDLSGWWPPRHSLSPFANWQFRSFLAEKLPWYSL